MKNLIWSCILLVFCSCSNVNLDKNSKLNFNRKQAINNNWKFMLGNTENAQNTNFNDSSWKEVNIPHDWAIEGEYSTENASATGYLPGGIAWYRKELVIEDFRYERKYKLLFDGAYQNAEVWINGKFLGKRPYGYSSFYFDVTELLHSGENVIAVRLDHSIVADSRWYTGNGIYRNVWLETTNKTHVKTWGTYITTPNVSAAEANVSIELDISAENSKTEEFIVSNVLFDKKNSECLRESIRLEISGDTSLSFNQIIQNPDLWSPESPTVYTSRITIHNANGELVDAYATTFGIRAIVFDANKGFFCNGKSYKLKGVCMHHDYGSLGAARTPEAIYPVLKKLKDAGCNAIRTSHNPEDPEYLNMLDTMGFFVMEEAFDEFKRGKKKWIKGRNVGQRLGIKAYPEYYNRNGYSDFYENWAKIDIQDMVRRDRNHPSIIMWSIGNETDYPNDPYQDSNVKSTFDPTLPHPKEIAVLVNDLVTWVKEFDTTRFVTQALANTPMTNAVGVPELLDVVGYNYQEKFYQADHEKYPERIIYGSENDDNPTAWKAVRDNDFIAGQFLWTGMDYHGEAGMFPYHSFAGGLIDYCGVEKADYYFRKSLWTDVPMAKLVVQNNERWSSKKMHWNWHANDKLKITCYTNCDSAKLTLNNKVIGIKELDNDALCIEWDNISFEAGSIKVECFRNETIVSSDSIFSAEEPSKLELLPILVHSEKFNYDLIQVHIRMVDSEGVVVPNASSEVSLKLSGKAKLLGLCNSDYSSLQSNKSNTLYLYEGSCTAIIKAENDEEFALSVQSKELKQYFSLF